MDVLLLAGYRQDCNHFALRRDTDNELIFLDRQIENLQSLDLNPIVVLRIHHAWSKPKASR